MSSDRESSVKLLLFNGKAESWDNWDFGFVCRAVIYRYDHILTGTTTCPTKKVVDALSTTTVDVDELKKIADYKANSMAFSHLVTSMDMKNDSCAVAIGILKSCRTDDLPLGDAAMAIKALRDYYNNKSVATVQSLLQQYHSNSTIVVL